MMIRCAGGPKFPEAEQVRDGIIKETEENVNKQTVTAERRMRCD